MASFNVKNLETAPGDSRSVLQAAKKKFGFVPNLLGVLAESPAALKAYVTLSELLEQTAFTPAEQQVILLAVSTENRCQYCVAAHTATAAMAKVPEPAVQALRENSSIADPKLEALQRFVRKVIAERGWVSQQDIEEFHNAGYTKRHVLEVLLGVAMKTLSNYTNHIAQTPLDAAFEQHAWRPTKAA